MLAVQTFDQQRNPLTPYEDRLLFRAIPCDCSTAITGFMLKTGDQALVRALGAGKTTPARAVQIYSLATDIGVLAQKGFVVAVTDAGSCMIGHRANH